MGLFEDALAVLGQDKSVSSNLYDFLYSKYKGLIDSFNEEEIKRVKARLVKYERNHLGRNQDFIDWLNTNEMGELFVRTLRNELFLMKEPFDSRGEILYIARRYDDPVIKIINLINVYKSLHKCSLTELVELDEKVFQKTGRRIVFCAGASKKQYEMILHHIDRIGDLSYVRKLVSPDAIDRIVEGLTAHVNKQTLTEFLDRRSIVLNNATINNIISYIEAGWDGETIAKILSRGNAIGSSLQNAMKNRIDISWHIFYLNQVNPENIASLIKIRKICSAATKLVKAGYDAYLLPVDLITGEYQLDAIAALIKKGVTDKSEIEALTVINKDAYLEWFRRVTTSLIKRYERNGISNEAFSMPNLERRASEEFDEGRAIMWNSPNFTII